MKKPLAEVALEDWENVEEELTRDDSFLPTRPAQALVDPGAGGDLAGVSALNRESEALARVGL
eukprot:783527-Pyramimonas_sp.AAC.1